MNTEFSYEDLESFNQADEQYFMEGEENLNGTLCYIVEVIGHTQTQYKRRLVWIDSVDWLLRKVKYYDKKNKLSKVLIFDEYQKIDDYHFASKMIMKNIRTGCQTVMDISDIKYNIDFAESYFSKDNLINP